MTALQLLGVAIGLILSSIGLAAVIAAARSDRAEEEERDRVRLQRAIMACGGGERR